MCAGKDLEIMAIQLHYDVHLSYFTWILLDENHEFIEISRIYSTRNVYCVNGTVSELEEKDSQNPSAECM